MPGLPKDGIRPVRRLARRSLDTAAFLAAALFFAACDGGGSLPAGSDALTGPGGSIPFTAAANSEASFNPADVVGPSCHDGDAGHLCLGLKVVAYKSAAGDPALSEAGTLNNVKNINETWAQCDLGFQIDAFDTVDPADAGLNYHLTEYSELEDVRTAYGTIDEMLIVTTGNWNRTGGLGQTTANAWTALPGGAPYGIVLEEPVGTFSNIIAHEVGHYLNLVHTNDVNNLMNPVIYSQSSQLDASECETARSAATYFWRRMLR